ncbi:MAG: transcriptional regulator [Bosea sp.]|uniref:transcriptional regulator n=1 Tax=Bosea sp. (in: a-proteobacteria) TaxID=1871050 RepID=UPI001AC3054F|nr:transcriptional regulator [Bosea sp. (in: a-proteobacteria)]MBN9471699.1 transcriptional regulator [Bosea sp. (in: a-proteobacteria)]
MARAPLDQVAKARAAWGEAIPAEVLALATACRAETSRAVAKRLGYSDAVISYVLANRYPGDLPKLFAKVRGAYLGETVDCPELGEMTRDTCLNWQVTPFAATNSTRVRMFHRCKTCPHRQQKDVA